MNTDITEELNETEAARKYNSRNADKFVVRLPEGMRKRIADVAKNYHRSMNSEIVSRLESSLRGEPCIQHEFTNDSDEDNTSIALDSNESITIDVTKEEFAVLELLRKQPGNKTKTLLELLSTNN